MIKIRDELLTKHFIKKGTKITSNDLCYIDSYTDNITVLDNEILKHMSLTQHFHHQQYDYILHQEAYKIIGQYTTVDIDKNQPLVTTKFESVLKKEQSKSKRQTQVEQILIDEMKNNIWL